jgi:hypothetical protein
MPTIGKFTCKLVEVFPVPMFSVADFPFVFFSCEYSLYESVPAVCTTSFATIEVLVTCLNSNVPTNDRRQSLLILNNLCVPIENKAAIVFGEPFEIFIDTLLELIRIRSTEAYLALVALLNLSYIQDNHGKIAIFNRIPTLNSADAASQYRYQLPIDNSLSTIRTIESLLLDFVPYATSQHNINSYERQCCRWSMNVIRNLINTIPSHAMSVGHQTRIPVLAVQCLSTSDRTNLTTWTRDSLEDACFMILIHICRYDDCVQLLKNNNSNTMDQLISICEDLKNTCQGIHQVRAIALLNRLIESNCGYSV